MKDHNYKKGDKFKCVKTGLIYHITSVWEKRKHGKQMLHWRLKCSKAKLGDRLRVEWSDNPLEHLGYEPID